MFQFLRSFFLRNQGSKSLPGKIDLPAPPDQIQFQPGIMAYPILNLLDDSFPLEYQTNIIRRVSEEHPQWSLNSCRVYMYEFKCFFILASLFKEVDMYSAEVDGIWHTALMFTREYESLCHSFAGEMIHHAPHTSDNKQPSFSLQKRTQFLLFYNTLFPAEEGQVNRMIWNMDKKEQVDMQWMEWVSKQTPEKMTEQYIRPQAVEIFGEDVITNILTLMINSLQDFFLRVAEKGKNNVMPSKRRPYSPNKSSSKDDASMDILSFAFLAQWAIDDDKSHHHSHMKHTHHDTSAPTTNHSHHSTHHTHSSCTSHSCSSSSSSCSSCSSCGSS